jgi:hypothetical protein
MKQNNLKIWSIAYLVFFVLFTGTIFAQSAINISGTFEGLRSQFDRSHKNFTHEFQYKYELTQDGDIVRGVSTIISDEGNYAEVGIRGIVKNNKFYFEEYNIQDQIISENMVWCYKSGVLNISEKENEIILSGKTPSYMVSYGFACTGGFTKISQLKEESNSANSVRNASISESIELNIFPNPTVEKMNFSIDNESAEFVSFEIYNLTGKQVFKSTKRQIAKGNFSESININEMGLSKGMYLLNLHLDNESFNKEFIISD